MLADLDLLLIAVFCAADDLLPVAAKNAKRIVTDAEVVALCVAQPMTGIASDPRVLAAARKRLGHLFAMLPDRSGFYKRREAPRHSAGGTERALELGDRLGAAGKHEPAGFTGPNITGPRAAGCCGEVEQISRARQRSDHRLFVDARMGAHSRGDVRLAEHLLGDLQSGRVDQRLGSA